MINISLGQLLVVARIGMNERKIPQMILKTRRGESQ